MKIGELAKLTGLATSRIRFYEASGLIRSQRKANGYRDYAADTVWILELVTGAPGARQNPDEIPPQRPPRPPPRPPPPPPGNSRPRRVRRNSRSSRCSTISAS
ncbi:MerR family DNA-binding transcriptional regulator, partial [Pseudomonas aeruginosa]|uniref:MerR family DNA-binding transcriptional regulator n=1 Tax=Pseudomonas aeruginosa TaxID=287 RepID=UPI0021F17225